jgi:hypothetical protein
VNLGFFYYAAKLGPWLFICYNLEFFNANLQDRWYVMLTDLFCWKSRINWMHLDDRIVLNEKYKIIILLFMGITELLCHIPVTLIGWSNTNVKTITA